jgi:hypothetical protein
MKKKKVVNTVPGAVFTMLHFLRNLRIDPESQSVKLQLAGKACQGETLYLIGSNGKLRRKKVL